MVSHFFEIIDNCWQYLLERLHLVLQAAADINPTQRAVLWVQLIAGSLTVIWIIFQIAWLRRLNEARLERYLENRIAFERDDLAQERTETLATLDHITGRRGLRYGFMLLWANARLTISLVLRMLSLGTARGLIDHTALLLQVGMLTRARSIYLDVAAEAMKKIRLYEDALANKRVEAQNALIFAGRIAVLEGRPVSAVSAFKKATRLKDDPDARLLIGKQLAVASDLDGALQEYRTALADESVQTKPATRAELHRSVAYVLMRQQFFGLARRELAAAKAIDEPSRNYAGMGRTEELLGDLYARKPRTRAAAENAYATAISNFELANDDRGAARVRRKRSRLTGQLPPLPDGWITRSLNRLALILLRTVERLRVRRQTQED